MTRASGRDGGRRMISFASNAEDVVLHRALCRDSGGFYVDVGALSPVIGSITKHFYDLGWRGINVEPLSAYAAELRLQRPRDVTLEVALDAAEGNGVLHVVREEEGLSTIVDELARAHHDDGLTVEDVQVQLTTLAAILDEHAPAEIDFIKIDVEGAERGVLDGGDWQRWRPRVVVVEATAPYSHEQVFDVWEPILLENGYRFASFDGLNRFYAREEEADVLVPLLAPASILDDFVRVEVVALEEELDRARSGTQTLEAYAERVLSELASTRERAHALEADLQIKLPQIRDLEEALAKAQRELAAMEESAGLASEKARLSDLRATRLAERGYQLETQLASQEGKIALLEEQLRKLLATRPALGEA